MFFLSKNLSDALWQALVFTVGHSLSLLAVVLGYIHVPTVWVECLIAASIFFVALHGALNCTLGKTRWGIIVVFGLLHGVGFATAFTEQGLPMHQVLFALLGFNVGVELAQALVILTCYVFIAKPFGSHPRYRQLVIVPGSFVIAAIALFWTIERFLAV